MMVNYIPVKYEFDWTNCFPVGVRKRKCGQTGGQTNGQKTDKRTQNFTNIERNLAMMMMYVPVKFEFDLTNRFQVRVWKRKCGRMDGWMDRKTDKKRTNGQKNGQTDKRTDGVTPISKGT